MIVYLFIFASISSLSHIGKGEVGFELDLSHQVIVFGETLVVNLTISPSEHIQDQTLEVRFAPDLLFSASVHSVTCDSTNRKNCTNDSKTIKESDLSNTGKFTFDNRVIEDSKQLIVFRNTSSWEPGYVHQTEIQLTNIASSDLSDQKFVVGVFRYWNPRVTNEENNVQNFVGRNFTLYPAKLSILVDGMQPNRTADSNRIYSGVETSITLVAEVDARIGTSLLKIELPSTGTGAACSGPPTGCNGTLPVSIPQLNIVKSTYSLGQGKGANKEVDVSSNQASSSNASVEDSGSLLLTPSMLTDGSGGACSGLCKANLTALVVTTDQSVKAGEKINVSAAIYYGTNFAFHIETSPIFLTVVGPDLDLTIMADPNSELESGMEVRVRASLRHSNTSEENLVVPKVAFAFPNEDAVLLVSGSATLSRNGGQAVKFDDSNVTQGILLDDFPLGASADISFRVTLTDELPLATKMPMKVGADFAFKRASDACLPAPCLHGGTCIQASNGQEAKCQCTSDYSGADCSKRVCKRGNWKTPTDTSDVCYYFPNKVLSFSMALQECAQLGTNLPSIHSAASDIYALASYWLTTLQNVSEVWVGLYRESPSSVWKWTDGQPVNFFDWYDDSQQSGPGNCVISSSAVNHNYRWLTRDCTVGYYFFCADPPKSDGGGVRLKSRNVFVDLVTKSLQAKTELGLGDRIRIHQPVTMTVSFPMPFGALVDAQLETVFTSNDVDPIPIVFVASDLVVPSSINVSRPDLLHAKESDFLVNIMTPPAGKRRSKRAAISSKLSIVRPLGKLVNSAKVGQKGAVISLNATYLTIGTTASNFSGAKFSVTAYLGVNDAKIAIGSKDSVFSKAELMFDKSFQSSAKSSGEVLVTATVSHAPTSTAPVYDLNYLDDLECLRVRQIPKDATYVSSCKEIRTKRSQLDVGDKMVMTYAISADKGMDYEPSFRNATINYTSIQPGEFLYQEYPGQRGAMEVSTCIIRKDDVMITDLAHMHSYSTLAFFLAIITACLVSLLVLYFYWKFKRKRRTGPADEERLLDGGDDTGSMRSGATAVIALKRKASKASGSQSHTPDIGTMTADGQNDESIIAALTEPAPQQMYRHLDCMDISAGAAIEAEMCASKLQNFLDCAAAVTSATIADEKLSEEIGKNLRKRINSGSQKVDQEHKQQLEKLRKTLRIKTGERLTELKNAQEMERHDIATKTEALSPLEKEAIMNTLKGQQKAEFDDLMHKLRVEQELELQRVSEELQAKKEGLLLEVEAQLFKDLLSEGKIDMETGDALSHELEKANSKILHWFDSERAHQRMLLEEKCQLRRHLAMQKELWDHQFDEVVETLIKQYLDAVDFLTRKGLINEAESQELRQESRKQVLKVREWLEKERRSREVKLNKTTAADKKKRINELKSQQQKDLDNAAKTLKEHKSSMTDPLDAVRELQKLASDQRRRLRALENELDEEAVNELNKLYQQLEKEFSQMLEDKKKSLLKSKNLPDQEISTVMSEQIDHAKILSEKHEFQRQKQMGKLEEVLNQLRQQATEQAEKEIADQTALRQHEKAVAKILIDQQASLSDTDRETLVRLQLEHLSNMKNGLALNRLHQIQLLEKKLAERKAGLVERLERRRLAGSKPTRKPQEHRPRTGSSEQAGSSSMSSEDERANQTGSSLQMSLLEYAQQRLHIARDITLDIEKEIETIRQTVLPQRAQILKEREDQLGALVAQLQIEKAKQIVELEQQEDALTNLTTCMVEDLNERGVLSNPDCHRILEKHQVEQQLLSERLQEQKEKQDLVLKQQLLERASKRRNVLEKKQQQLSESRPVTAGQHIDNLNMIHNYALEREKFMQQSERELEQALQEQRREFELKKRQALQDQEIDLINNLVQMGDFNKSEVSGVLRVLFPDKTKHEVKELAKKVYKKSAPDEPNRRRPSPVGSTNQPSLTKRLEMTAHVKDLIEDRATDSSSSPGIDVRRKRNNGVRVQRPGSRPRTHLPPISRRPEPVGASVDQVTEYLPDRRIARIIGTAQITAPRQTYHQ